MTRRAVLVSDLHLSTNPRLDDFTRDDEFAALLAAPELRPDGDVPEHRDVDARARPAPGGRRGGAPGGPTARLGRVSGGVISYA